MFNNNPQKIYMEILKNKSAQKNPSSLDLPSRRHYSVFLESQTICSGMKGDIMDMISKLPTYKKICLLQGLLKEMKSIKERLEDNMDNMLKKIYNNSLHYFKNKIEMKKIFDFSQSENKEINLNYVLFDNTEEKLTSVYYQSIYDMLFLIRENYTIVLLLIKFCKPQYLEPFADFLVTFFYENTINPSFNQEDLMIFIYLIIEDFIMNKMPKSSIPLYTKNDEFLNYEFLNYIFKYLTRIIDVRNYTCLILSANILKLEESNDDLNISIHRINELSHNSSKKNSIVSDEQIVKLNSDDYDFVVVDSPNFKFNKSPSPSSTDIDKLDEIQEKYFANNFDKKINYIFPEINQFFYDNDITLEFLNTKIEELENKTEQDIITIMMRDYLDLQINQISTESSEIFSNYIKILEIKNFISSNDKEYSDKVMNLIIDNYTKITKFIDDILLLFKNNLRSIPYIIKSICNIFDILINKKYNKNGKKKNYLDYIKLMIISNFILGKIIIPLLLNPDFNGLITTAVVSKITRENLKIIYKILFTMLSGKLFSNKKDFEFTIFNKYILDTLPKIFNIILEIISQKNFTLSNQIQKLINSSDEINNPERNLEYDYFKENQENLRQQSICFNFENIYVLIEVVCNCGQLFTEDKYQKYFKLIESFIKSGDLWGSNKNSIKKGEYYLVEKITYSPNLTKLINNISQDNVFALMPNIQNDELSIFKNCLADLLAYVNILNKENFNYFMQKKKKNLIPFEQKIKKNYPRIIFDEDQERINQQPKMELLKDLYEELDSESDEEIDEENQDANFKDIIFPQIIDIVKRELSNNTDTDKAKRIVFCSSYLQTHMSNLPTQYKKNNYSLLLMEVIKKSEEIIKELNLSILNNFYIKVTGGDKLNMITSSYLIEIKNIEKWVCIEFLFEKINLPCKFNLQKTNEGALSKVEYVQIENKNSYIYNIQSFIKNFPNFRKYEKNYEDIIDFEEKVELDVALNAYFKDLKDLIKKEQIIARFSKEEQNIITEELENYILLKLYEKLYPKNSTKNDIKFYKKCCRLDFIKPENIIKDKNMINENLWKTSMSLINEMDEKLTPVDKVKSFGKALTILQNSITFSSGKNELGIDDTVSCLVYVLLKSKPKNIFSNSKYCQLFLNPRLAKKQYGILMSQIEMAKNIVFDMKYTDLMNVTEEEFGKDEEV